MTDSTAFMQALGYAFGRMDNDQMQYAYRFPFASNEFAAWYSNLPAEERHLHTAWQRLTAMPTEERRITLERAFGVYCEGRLSV